MGSGAILQPMRLLVVAVVVVAALVVGYFVVRDEDEPDRPAVGGAWLASGRAGVGSEGRQWSNCAAAVRPDLSDELVVCRWEGRYQCYSPGDQSDPETWALLQWNARCSRARDVLVAKRLIMTL
jgi:hypothetical protein